MQRWPRGLRQPVPCHDHAGDLHRTANGAARLGTVARRTDAQPALPRREPGHPRTVGVTAGVDRDRSKGGRGRGAIAGMAEGGKIAFMSFRDGNWEIYLMHADGTGLVNLTNNPAQDEWPAWSPDGSRIAFITTRDGNPEIYAVNADGSGSTRITSNPWQYFTPVWSPDGTKIAFSGYDGSSQIYVVNADGSNVTRLTSIGSASSPVWSPDGSKIAFASNGDGHGEVYLINADGSGVRNLTNNPASDFGPAWRPRGP